MSKEAISLLVVIANRKLKDNLVEDLHEHKALFINSIYGHGSLDQSSLANAFGFVSEPEKIVITAFIHTEDISVMIELLENKFKFKEANTGFAFTIPVGKISR